jgi:hypothetical protein
MVDAVDKPFNDSIHRGRGAQSAPIFFYEFDKQGDVSITNQATSPFQAQTVFDKQLYAVSYQAIVTGNTAWAMVCRDEVNKLGPISGGKHAGQPMPGDPVNWCDLDNYNGGPDLARAKRKGTALGINVLGDLNRDDGILLGTASFKKPDGTNLCNQPRKSYYSGGLAVEFRFSSPMQLN